MTSRKITPEMQDKAEIQIRELQKEISFDTKDYPIEVLVNNYRDGDFYIPEYQRQFIWDEKTKNRFIESILLGLPVPFMFFSDNEDGRNEIIDGAQRTCTLEEFLYGDLKLSDLEKLDTLNNFTFLDLPELFQRKFKKRTIRVIELSEETTMEIKQDLFNRINTGGVKALPIEIRRGSYRGLFMSFIEECAKNKLFNQLCPISETMKKRREDSELVLRFFAYLNNYQNFEHSVTDFLDDFLREHQGEFNKIKFELEFQTMLNFVNLHFPFGFRKTKTAKSTPRVRFEAISVGVALALREDPNLVPSSIEWIETNEFKIHTTTHSSNTQKRVVGRIEFVRDSLLLGDKYENNI